MLEADDEIEVISLEVEKAKIPLFLREFQTIPFSEGYESGFRSLADHLGVGLHLDRVGFGSAEETESAIKKVTEGLVEPPSPPTEPRVFVAYDVRDQEYANRLSSFLKAQGIQRWMAPGDIQPGARWGVALVEGVMDSTAMIAVMSPDSMRSTWVQRELQIAGGEGMPILPILVAGQPFESLQQSQYFDARGGQMPG